MYNVLDYAATSFVTGLTVDKSIDQLNGYEPLGDICKAVNEDCEYNPGPVSYIFQMLTKVSTDDAELMHGLPISLQLVAQRLEEEKVIAMTKHVLEVIA